MRPRIKGIRTFAAGGLFIVVGSGAFFLSQGYDSGTALQMGPGYFPAVLSVLLIALGLGAVITGMTSQIPDPILKHKLEPLLLILAGVLSFSYLIDRAGLIVAAATLIMFACFRRLLTNPVEVIVTYLVLVTFSAVVFVRWFGMIIPLF
jgi:hypothetical protein